MLWAGCGRVYQSRSCHEKETLLVILIKGFCIKNYQPGIAKVKDKKETLWIHKSNY